MEYNLMGIMADYSFVKKDSLIENVIHEFYWSSHESIKKDKDYKLIIHKTQKMSYDEFICFIENKKFIYKVIKEGARAHEYEDALQWLVDARLVHKLYRSTTSGLPISAYDDLSAFKIYLVYVGLLRRLAQLAPTAFGEGTRLFTEFKGALTENFVLQTLITQFEVTIRYWTQAKSFL